MKALWLIILKMLNTSCASNIKSYLLQNADKMKYRHQFIFLFFNQATHDPEGRVECDMEKAI